MEVVGIAAATARARAPTHCDPLSASLGQGACGAVGALQHQMRSTDASLQSVLEDVHALTRGSRTADKAIADCKQILMREINETEAQTRKRMDELSEAVSARRRPFLLEASTAVARRPKITNHHPTFSAGAPLCGRA